MLPGPANIYSLNDLSGSGVGYLRLVSSLFRPEDKPASSLHLACLQVNSIFLCPLTVPGTPIGTVSIYFCHTLAGKMLRIGCGLLQETAVAVGCRLGLDGSDDARLASLDGFCNAGHITMFFVIVLVAA